MSPWKKIMLAADRDAGLRLNADEVWLLSQDDAIRRVAEQEDDAVPGGVQPIFARAAREEVKDGGVSDRCGSGIRVGGADEVVGELSEGVSAERVTITVLVPGVVVPHFEVPWKKE